jgi:hypothetical protein
MQRLMWGMQPKITQEHEEYQGYPERNRNTSLPKRLARFVGLNTWGRGLREGGMCGWGG